MVRLLKSPFPLVFVIGAASLTIRAMLDSEFGHGTLLYVVVPFVLSMALYALTRGSARPGRIWDYLNFLRSATIVFLVTSAFLFEGFLCVLMFMPIFYVMVTIGYLFGWMLDRNRDGGGGGGRLGVVTIPVLVALLATEGLVPATTVPRDRTATYSAVVPGDAAALQRNMAAPIVFPGVRPWFVRLFPLPDRVEAGSLGVGDTHRLHFTYKKWFLTNYQTGEMVVRIAQVAPRHIRTQVLGNTSYLSHYMRIDGTDVRFDPVEGASGAAQTRVTLTVRYRRLLDPAWYFGPMEQLAAEQSARYLVDSIIVRAAS